MASTARQNPFLQLRALGASLLGLPVVVAGALVLVAVEARRHAQAGVAALVAEEEARLPVLGVAAPVLAHRLALCNSCTATSTTHPTHISFHFRRNQQIQIVYACTLKDFQSMSGSEMVGFRLLCGSCLFGRVLGFMRSEILLKSVFGCETVGLGCCVDLACFSLIWITSAQFSHHYINWFRRVPTCNF